MAIALPALIAASMTAGRCRALDGIAETYLALAATLRQQDAGDFAMILLRLALDLRPDFTPARLLAADIMDSGRHLDNALQMLATVGNDDPLIAVVRLQRAAWPSGWATPRTPCAIFSASRGTIPEARCPTCVRATSCAASSASPMRSLPTTAQ